MTLTFELDLDILPLDLHAKIQVCMSVCLVRRVVTHTHTDRQTHNVETITPVADAGCKNDCLKLTTDESTVRASIYSHGTKSYVIV